MVNPLVAALIKPQISNSLLKFGMFDINKNINVGQNSFFIKSIFPVKINDKRCKFLGKSLTESLKRKFTNPHKSHTI